jgi:hypothetical protein
VSSRDDADALAVGRAVLALLEALRIGSTSAPAVYTQDSLPPGAKTKETYLERHRDRVRAGVPGWDRAGQTRRVTAEAWELDVAEQTSRSRRPRTATARPAANDTTDKFERAFDIRFTRGGR